MSAYVREPLDFADADEYDVFYWLAKNCEQLPQIRFDCGCDDAMFAENERLHFRLVEAGIEHEFEENAGGHDWSYWRSQLPKTLEFFSELCER